MTARMVTINRHRDEFPTNTREDWQRIEAALYRAWRIAGWYGEALRRLVALETASLRGRS